MQEENVSEAFSRQSAVFDEADNSNLILQWMRSRVRGHVLELWKPGERILELNAGTGSDALYFAQRGFYLHATDNAKGMQEVLNKKVTELHFEDKITSQLCSFLELNKIEQAPFDHIFSNFGGLNCTNQLDDVIHSFSPLLKPGGTVTLVLMPPVCPWEMLTVLKGNFNLAFRRFKKDGAASNLEGVTFNTWYYSPKEVRKMFGKNYRIISLTGLGVTVPPPHRVNFPIKHPKTFLRLISLEKSIASMAPFHSWADHFIISARKTF